MIEALLCHHKTQIKMRSHCLEAQWKNFTACFPAPCVALNKKALQLRNNPLVSVVELVAQVRGSTRGSSVG